VSVRLRCAQRKRGSPTWLCLSRRPRKPKCDRKPWRVWSPNSKCRQGGTPLQGQTSLAKASVHSLHYSRTCVAAACTLSQRPTPPVLPFLRATRIMSLKILLLIAFAERVAAHGIMTIPVPRGGVQRQGIKVCTAFAHHEEPLLLVAHPAEPRVQSPRTFRPPPRSSNPSPTPGVCPTVAAAALRIRTLAWSLHL
jgi:hypothetical protein